MNIAFDATAILGPMSKNRGIGNYGLAQFREMIARDQNNHYFFFNLFEPFSLGDYPDLTEEYFDCGKNLGLLTSDGCAVMGALIRSFIEKNKIDVFYITSPFDSHIPPYRREWLDGCKTVATVYDIIPYVFREHYFGKNIIDASWYLERIDMLRWVDELLVISQSVKDDLMHYLNFSGDNIDVIWGAPGDMFQKIKVSAQEARTLQKKYHLKDRFIMCTGGDDERKNIAGLIEAYGKLPHGLMQQFGLTIVCKLQEASVKRYRALAKKYGVEHEVALTNFVTSEELVQLYNLSSLVAFPSKYEGFGLPVTEAWACGKPVLTSNNSSLCQISGDAATLVDADDIDDIARGLEKALQPEVLTLMTQRGAERLKMFQWSEVADRAIDAIARLTPRSTVKKELTKLAVFTPLPPQQSGIADYGFDILCAIADEFRIDVYIDDGYQPNCMLPDSIRVLNHRHFHQNAKNYDHILYQMGNSLFHYYMYPYLRRYGGILVLHDYNMHGVAQGIGLGLLKDNFKTYEEYLREDLTAEQIVPILAQCRQGKWPDQRTEINGFVTNYADKIIVHSRYAMEGLLRKNIGRTVARIPHYAVVDPLPDTIMTKRDLGVDPDSLVLAAFGHIHETKRAIPLLKAAIRYLKENRTAKFLFVGKLDQSIAKEFERIRQDSGVEQRILVTGYTSLENYCKYMDATDVCFNLRYPYNGENSGSLARILSRGKCVVVNDVGSFSEVPDDACIKLPPVETMTPKEEEEQIYQTMKRLLEEPEDRQKIGRRAREYAEKELNLEIIGRKYADFILSSGKNEISEETLRNLRENEIAPKHYSDEEIRNMARTLAYCVE